MKNNNFHFFPVRITEENIDNLPHYRKKKKNENYSYFLK